MKVERIEKKILHYDISSSPKIGKSENWYFSELEAANSQWRVNAKA